MHVRSVWSLCVVAFSVTRTSKTRRPSLQRRTKMVTVSSHGRSLAGQSRNHNSSSSNNNNNNNNNNNHSSNSQRKHLKRFWLTTRHSDNTSSRYKDNVIEQCQRRCQRETNANANANANVNANANANVNVNAHANANALVFPRCLTRTKTGVSTSLSFSP